MRSACGPFGLTQWVDAVAADRAYTQLSSHSSHLAAVNSKIIAPRSRWCVHKLYIHPFYRFALVSKVFAVSAIRNGSRFTHMRNAPK